MFSLDELLTYIGVAALLVVVPGPNSALILAQTLEGGRRAGLATVAGVELGTLMHTVAASLGLSAVLMRSAVAFDLIKLLGAVVLVFLGLRELFGKNAASPAQSRDGSKTLGCGRALMRALIGNLLNPKVAMFFLAFLPQWVHPARGSVVVQFFVLGSILSLLGGTCGAVLALAAGQMVSHFAERMAIWRWQRRFTGMVLVGLGLRLIWLERH